jgi:cellulose synthase/poly-beta-1,6-N-acetylglucosamine synthase-like glycosyltransferase
LFTTYFNAFITVYLWIYTLYLLLCCLGGAFDVNRRRRMESLHNVVDHEYYYPISILVPAYNEESAIVQTVRNLLRLEFKRYEIVVIDDGSRDNTKQCMLDAFPLAPETARPVRYQGTCHPIHEIYSCRMGEVLITLISKENGGCKADAVNAGINVAAYPYIINMDGDEILQKDSLRLACRALMESSNVVAVGGNIKISNNVHFRDAMPVSGGMGRNAIVNMQILEYSRGFLGTRVFQDMMNANLIISGGYGLFRKDALIAMGGYDPVSKGEDMEITVKLQQHFRKNKIPFSMRFVPESICWTQGPASMKDLRSQRTRWHCGLIQTIAKHRSMILNPRYGVVGMFMLPYIILYELLSPIFMVLGCLSTALSLVLGVASVFRVATAFLLYVLLGLILTTITYIDNRYCPQEKLTFLELVKVVFYGLLDAFFFRPYIALVNFSVFFKYKKITRSKWVSPVRVKVTEEP